MSQTNPYEDIINVDYPQRTSRPRMSMTDRAAQFSPFAALTGYDALIGEITKHTNNPENTDVPVDDGF